MVIDIDSLLGAEIIRTEEDSKSQTLFVTLLLDEDSAHESLERKMRFDQVTHYSRSEIAHEGYPVILEISESVPDIEKNFDNDHSRKRFKIDTTSGIIVLEFERCEIVD
ncbi:hypothetical protein [Sphingobacterium endophyticum]|uniref:hypothetical protein n=1 Tax=Sphingobacterium endophyticum TaxID=2546448 RepID=UPI0012E1DC82|nr:hypothetical protein [Sphingobacterium endophyticum]